MKAIYVFMMLIAFAMPVLALDASTETTKQQTQQKEQSLSNKKSTEESESEGLKKSETQSIEQRQESSESSRQSFNFSLNDTIKTELNIMSVFLMMLDFDLKTPADFGLTAKKGFMVDAIKAEYLNQSAASNAPVTGDVKAIRDYMIELTETAFLVKNSAPLFWSYVNELGGSNVKAVNVNNHKPYKINGLFSDEIYLLATQAINDGLNTSLSYADNILLSQMKADIQKECTFYRQSISTIKCGNVVLDLSANQLLYKNQLIFGGDTFFGSTLKIEVAQSDSYSNAIERMKSSSELKSFAESVDRYSEQLIKEGRYKEAAMLQKRAFDLAKSSKANISLAKILPQLN